MGCEQGPNQPARSREQNELDSIAPHGLDDGPRNASQDRLAQVADTAIPTHANERWVEASASPTLTTMGARRDLITGSSARRWPIWLARFWASSHLHLRGARALLTTGDSRAKLFARR